MNFINMIPAWDWNAPRRMVCIEPRFTTGYDTFRANYHRRVLYGERNG
jgi:hypothetical protein